ncbi:transposase [Methanomethylovorans hollandica]|uniref:transposase n=1 Tax=Methanomethylovorans hollandica TaxID=101192 RepID=UPI000662510E|nr:transposase [Methanomethylovorans hollandica]
MIILSLVDHGSELARYRTINLYDLLEDYFVDSEDAGSTLVTNKNTAKEHWRKRKTTNILARVKKELKRSNQVIGSFFNKGTLLRL